MLLIDDFVISIWSRVMTWVATKIIIRSDRKANMCFSWDKVTPSLIRNLVWWWLAVISGNERNLYSVGACSLIMYRGPHGFQNNLKQSKHFTVHSRVKRRQKVSAKHILCRKVAWFPPAQNAASYLDLVDCGYVVHDRHHGRVERRRRPLRINHNLNCNYFVTLQQPPISLIICL